MSRRKTHEEFIAEMSEKHPTIEVLDEYVNNHTKISVRCECCGRIWSVTPGCLLQGYGCRVCNRWNNKNIKSHEAFMKDFAVKGHPDIEILGKYKLSYKPIKVKCKCCNRVWHTTPHMLLFGHGCSVCRKCSTSYVEQVIACTFRNIFGDENVLSRNVSVIEKELDVYVPELNFAVEYGSWYWHKNRLSNDIEKQKICCDKNIRLITIYDGCSKGCCFQDEFFQNENVWLYDEFLGDRKNDGMLHDLISRLLNIVGVDYLVSDSEWDDITKKAILLSRKRTTEEYRNKLAAVTSGIVCLGDYVSSDIGIQHRCTICGHEWLARPASILHGCGCPKCAGNMLKTTEQYKKELASVTSEIICLDEYVNYGFKILHKCTVCNHEWLITPSNALGGHGCPKCAGRKLKTTEEYRKELADLTSGIVCLDRYVNNKTKILHKCTICGHEWFVRPNVILRGHGCPKCAVDKIAIKSKRTTEEYRRDLANVAGTIVCIDTYVNNYTKIKHRCLVCGHEWLVVPNSILSGCGCPKCASVHRGKKHAKKVLCVETGIVYDSFKEAARAVGLSSGSAISNALRRGTKSGGYHWEYVNCA